MSLLRARGVRLLGAVLLATVACATFAPAAPPPAAAATAPADPLGAELMRLANLDRAALGLKPMAADPELIGLAKATQFACPSKSMTVRGRAQDMADRNYFSHDISGCPNPLGGTYDMLAVLDRVFGYRTSRAENIAMNSGYSAATDSGSYATGCDINGNNCRGIVTSTADAVSHAERIFMKSSSHRGAILGSYDRFGCGAASRATSPVTYYYVCLFSKGGPTALVSQPNAQTPTYASSTYVPFGPVRIVDSRQKLGLGAALTSGKPATFQVRGVKGIPTGAVAVSGNLTVVNATRIGYVSISPVATATPPSSTLNINVGDIRANAVVVPLDRFGKLSVIYATGGFSDTAHVVFDVTGYFTAGTGGKRYVPLSPSTPARVLDTAKAVGGGHLVSRQPVSFAVAGRSGIPSTAVAVAGVVTMSRQTVGGYVSVTTTKTAQPLTSTVNAPAGETRSNGIILPLGSGGTLSIVYAANSTTATADATFDVTGYFVAGSTGAVYVPVVPARLVDSRIDLGVTNPLSVGGSSAFAVAGLGGVATGAKAVTGNVTVTAETGGGCVALQPAGGASVPAISFPGADNRATGLLVPLSTAGQLDARLTAPSSSTRTELVFDVTGYFR